MKRRNFIGGGLGVAAASLGLAACSNDADGTPSGGPGGAPTEIIYWLWQDDATDSTWTDLAEAFNTSQDAVSVTLETIPLDQYQNKLTTAAMNNTGPDAARCKDWWLGQFAPEGATADLTDFVEGWSGKDDVVEGLWATGQLPGSPNVFMLPHQYVTLYMYYRKDYFDEAGLQPPTTQDEFLTAAAALTSGERYGIDVRGGGGGQDQWLGWMYAGGAQVVDDSGAVVLNDQAGVDANQRYLSIVTELQAAPPGSITAAFADVKTNFASGLTAMMIHHPGSLAEMTEVFGENLGVIPIPGTGTQPSRTLGSMSGNIIMANSEKQEAAWAWISWLSESGQMATMSTSPQGQLPVLSSVMESEDFTADANLKVAIDAIPDALTWPALKGVATLAGKEWNPTIQQGFQGEMSSQEVLDAMAAVLED
ncbi:MAG: ABC transporter substrate-binding protein [Arachnia sp.]